LSGQDRFGTGLVYVLLATLGWSLSGLFVRFLPHLDGWQINAWRGFWMATALLVYMVLRYGDRFLHAFADVPRVALWSSALCFAIGTTFYVTSLTLVSTATVSVIGAASPLITGLLSPWITGERPSAYAWGAALIALVGMFVISKDGLATGHILGILTSFGVMLTFATQTLLLRRYRSIDMMPAICLGGFLAFVGNGLLGFTSGTVGGGFAIDMNSMLLLALMGPLQLAIPLIFYAQGAKIIPAMALSLLAMLDAVLNPLWPWLIVGEVPNRAALIGGVIILGAVLFSTFAAWYAGNRNDTANT
jgi:drug/metabolite transporter, DME family